jgi:choline monooxygenase
MWRGGLCADKHEPERASVFDPSEEEGKSMAEPRRDLIEGDGPFHPLPPRWFTDPAILAREKEAIFYRTWRYVGHESDLPEPGSYVTARIVDQDIFLIRARGGEIRAFYNVCQHRAHELLRGAGKIKAVITCPYHAWAYDTQGRLKTARNCEKVPGFDKTAIGLTPVRVETLLGLLFVNLDPDAPSFASLFPGLAGEITALVPAFRQLVKEPRAQAVDDTASLLKANWKVLMDNCSECYHCGPAHPAFVDLVDMESYRIALYENYTRHEMKCRKPRNAAYGYAADAPVKVGVFWHLWPNMTLGVMPGSPNFDVFTFEPAGVELTRLGGDAYRLAEGDDDDAARARYNAEVLWPEDRELCESVQRGLRSRGYRGGRFMVDRARGPISEHVPYYFHRKVAEAVGEV